MSCQNKNKVRSFSTLPVISILESTYLLCLTKQLVYESEGFFTQFMSILKHLVVQDDTSEVYDSMPLPSLKSKTWLIAQSIDLSVCFSICQTCLSDSLVISLSVCLCLVSVCLSVCLVVCLSV